MQVRAIVCVMGFGWNYSPIKSKLAPCKAERRKGKEGGEERGPIASMNNSNQSIKHASLALVVVRPVFLLVNE
jgi:hypothetical protein